MTSLLPPERWLSVHGELHAATEPAAIAADQRAALAAHLELCPDATAEDLSAAVWLPVDVVTRRLIEMQEGK